MIKGTGAGARLPEFKFQRYHTSWGKLLNFLMSQFPHLRSVGNDNMSSTGLRHQLSCTCKHLGHCRCKLHRSTSCCHRELNLEPDSLDVNSGTFPNEGSSPSSSTTRAYCAPSLGGTCRKTT